MADPAREKLIEAVAESDDALIEQYLDEGTLPEATIAQGAKAGFANARLAPVFVGSASKAIGIDRLLDFIVEEFPSPAERAPLAVIAKGGEEQARSCDANGPLTAFVFKTVSDPFVGHITMFRVFSGKVRPDTSVHNATQGTDERIGQLFALKGKDHESVSEVPAGDIGAVAKLPHTHTGDTFSTKDDPVQLPAVELPEPLLAYAISPKTKGEEDRLATGLARLREEDPTFRVARNDETHETVIYGMGEAHLGVQMARLKSKFGVEVEAKPAKIAYRETIRGRGKAQGRHVKQSGGHGQYAVCEIEIEPLPRGEGFVYEDKIFGGAIPQQFIPSIEKGIVKTMSEGVLSGNPMVDIKVTLVDGKFHSVDSSDMAFQIAGSLALKEVVEQAGVALLEPIVQTVGDRPRLLHRRHHGRPQRQAREDPRDGSARRRQAGDQRAGPAGRGRALRDRSSLDDGWPRRVLDGVLPLRGDAAAPRAEGDRRVPACPRGSPQEVRGGRYSNSSGTGPRSRSDGRRVRMSDVGRDRLERMTEEALEHLRLIHKYTAWMALFVVLFGVLALIGVFLGNVATFS